MLKERPLINNAIFKILAQNGFEIDRNPTHYAGGKTVWRYNSVLGQKGNLEIDLTKCKFEKEKLRVSLVTYLAMTDIELSNLKPTFINYRSMDIRNRLFPVLKQTTLPWNPKALTKWGRFHFGRATRELIDDFSSKRSRERVYHSAS